MFEPDCTDRSGVGRAGFDSSTIERTSSERTFDSESPSSYSISYINEDGSDEEDEEDEDEGAAFSTFRTTPGYLRAGIGFRGKG